MRRVGEDTGNVRFFVHSLINTIYFLNAVPVVFLSYVSQVQYGLSDMVYYLRY